MKLRLYRLVLAPLLLLLGTGLASAHIAGSMEEASTMSAETGLPILLEVGTSW
jgi:hypothetical protein